MNNKTVFHWIKTGNLLKYILLMGILAFFIIPQLVSGETTGTATITGNVIHFPLARFTANITAGPAPLVVQFADQSGNDPAYWHWDFGDGTGSTDRNPTHTYAQGIYTVNLTVSNAAGSSTIVAKNYITGLPGQAGPSQSSSSPASGGGGGGGGGGSGSPVPTAGTRRSVPLAPGAPSTVIPVSGQMAPVPGPAAPATTTTGASAAGVPLMMTIGGVFAALAITSVAVLIFIRRKK